MTSQVCHGIFDKSIKTVRQRGVSIMKSIQSDIEQLRPVRTLGSEATIALSRTASLVKHELEIELEEHGITLQQFNVLRILRGAKEPLPTMEIGARMIEREPGITRLLSRLEAKELVQRTRCTEDARRIWIAITDKGLNLLTEIGELSEFGVREPIQTLDAEELTVFIKILDKIRAAMPA